MFGLSRTKSDRTRAVWTGCAADYAIAQAWSRDGRYLAVASSTGPITIFAAADGRSVANLAGHESGTLGLAWAPHRNLLATGGKDGTARLWNESGAPVFSMRCRDNWVDLPTWSSDGSLLAAAAGRTLHVWKADGTAIAVLPDHPSTISDLAWQPNATTLAVAAYGGVTLWSFGEEAGQPTSRMLRWKGSPLRLAWSPNGTMLAHGNQDATVHFWYVASNDELQMWGYARKVRELSWDSTNRYLATGGSPMVTIWDCGGTGPQGSRPQMLGINEDGSFVTALTFQPRGTLLASGYADGRTCVWEPSRRTLPLVGTVSGDGTEVTALAWSPDERSLAIAAASGLVAVITLN